MAELVVQRVMDTLQSLLGAAADFLPRVLAMLIIVILGWVIAFIVKAGLRRILKILRFDAFSENSGVSQALRKTGLPGPSELLSRIAFWVVGLCFTVLGVSVLGIPEFHEMIASFFKFVPQIFVALLILFVGILAANFLSTATLLAAVNADLPFPRLLGGSVRLLIMIVTIMMALEQVGLARSAVLIAFSITFGAVMLALAIAFGLGGREAAARLVEKHLFERRKEKEKEEDISPL
jgi:Mechanosensitive ion channel, conserved TM helix